MSRRRPGTLRIGELAARTGLTAPTIRYYEQIGLLPGGVRPSRSHRIYTEEDVDRLDLLRRLRDLLGVSLDELKKIAAAEETAAALPARIRERAFSSRQTPPRRRGAPASRRRAAPRPRPRDRPPGARGRTRGAPLPDRNDAHHGRLKAPRDAGWPSPDVPKASSRRTRNRLRGTLPETASLGTRARRPDARFRPIYQLT